MTTDEIFNLLSESSHSAAKEDKKQPLKYVFLYTGHGWYLMIDSLDALNAYMEMVWKTRQEDFLHSVKQMKEGRHITSDVIYFCETLAKLKGTDMYQEYQTLKEKQFHDMSDMILHDQTLYVNGAGGYTPHLDDVMNRYESTELRWPVFKEEDIRIKTWPGGTHYYAYIGPIQVKDHGVMKWDSEADAKLAAMHYVTKKGESYE